MLASTTLGQPSVSATVTSVWSYVDNAEERQVGGSPGAAPGPPTGALGLSRAPGADSPHSYVTTCLCSQGHGKGHGRVWGCLDSFSVNSAFA